MELRLYQGDLISEARSHMVRGVKSVLIQSPTGSGKTLLTAYMLKTSAAKGLTAWFMVHRKELIDQSSATFHLMKLPHGIISAGYEGDPRQQIQICSIQTLARRLNKIKKPPDLLVFDECHHNAATTWTKVYDRFPEAYKIGLTATPERLDGKGLSKYFAALVKGPSVRWLIDNGFLCDYKIFAFGGMDTSGMRKIGGDYVASDLAKIADTPTIIGNVIHEYKSKAQGKRAIIFCTTVEHSKHVVDRFNQEGIPASHLDGESPIEDRRRIIKDFRSGNVRVLSNVNLFCEGFDLPGIEVAILLRPTASLGFYLQMVGRVLRPAEGKPHAIILDHAGNCLEHGLPDEEREWALEGRKKRKGVAPVKLCHECYACVSAGCVECPHCGAILIVRQDVPEDTVHVLTEIDRVNFIRERKLEEARCYSYEDFLELGKQRKYRNPSGWAYLRMKLRREKNKRLS